MQFRQTYDSPLGAITLASDGDALTGLWFDGQKYFGATLTDFAEERPLPVFDETRRWLDVYFQGLAPDSLPPMALAATPFRLRVWEALRRIPYGETVTYGDIARELARERGLRQMSAQAVGGAVGHNPISILIPCHRVVGTDGSLTGYAGGIGRKIALLRLEGANVSALRW